MSTDDLVKRKEGCVKLTTEHKLFIMKYMNRNQIRRFTAANVRDELHRAFGETECSYFSLSTIRIAMKRLGFSFRKSSIRPPLAFAP